MDIHAGIIAVALFAVAGAFFIARAAIRIIQSARKMTFYRLRQQRTAGGWRLFFLAILLLGFALWLPFYGEPIAFTYFPPSPTPSLTPTITLIPTITLTPTITSTPTLTNTPSTTDTPTLTVTPSLPIAIGALFESVVTPDPGAVFSPIEFSTEFDGVNAVNPQTVFQNPITHMYGSFSYDHMIPGVQWTQIWLRDSELVDYQTKPWDGTTGGYGYVDSANPTGGWLPGSYEIQLFVGLDWKGGGRFIVQGEVPTSIPSITPSPTVTAMIIRTPSAAATSTRTPRPTSAP